METDSDSLQPVAPDPVKLSNLDLIKSCDSFPYPDTDPELYSSYVTTYYRLYIPPRPRPLGYLLPSVALTLQGIPGWTISEKERTLTLTLPPSPVLHSTEPETGTDHSSNQPTDEQKRTAIVARTTAAMRETGHWQVLKKWRNELYPIYSRDEAGTAELLCSIERCASPLFGIVTYGCHMTAYVRTGLEKADIKIWVSRRARSKQTYGGMLDQTVAGGIATGEGPFECLVREAGEEASLPEWLVRERTVAVGTVTYFHIRDRRAGGETRLMQPECQYCYDLDMTVRDGEDEVVPVPSDDEVEEFMLMGVGEVREALERGEFKPNCALVMLEFLVRHGILTPENEKDYVEIVARLHRRLDFPTA